ncbi:diphosphomevalonate/mevalonate 3,5-bisphosphate decarboxylase family protein [Flavimarina sp. Hel_I_48]|uniref:diphosphomevalonate/mevalonate 3,5-bisphosphate decarboxylase family protein n=1 Tax=Flavimarina sp. Hel_I_48 TaxID=1392488 RepID=UPI0004DF3EAF|nr:diphosphomevalonate decarboxylase [Flavimarina sp. Hel_I_48]
MSIEEFVPKTAYSPLPAGKVGYESPSNIALIKYWGKHGEQLPKNTSVSFTLTNCKTTTTLSYSPLETEKPEGSFDFEVYLENERKPDFEPKIGQFFTRIEQYLPFLRNYKFIINTSNSFPHSSGIASSASGMSALALCLLQMEQKMITARSEEFFLKKASFLARLGSGSACRSISGPVVSWGEHNNLPGSSALYGTPFIGGIAPVFEGFQDTILLVDTGKKEVSSTVGHNLMNDHPYAENRFQQAEKHIDQLLYIFKNGDLEGFVSLVEQEALTLHAMMMTSKPYFILMKENTLSIINKIWEFRKETGLPVCFTLDAGANVHVLYPEKDKQEILKFIKEELAIFCQNGRYISDFAGKGSKALLK